MQMRERGRQRGDLFAARERCLCVRNSLGRRGLPSRSRPTMRLFLVRSNN